MVNNFIVGALVEVFLVIYVDNHSLARLEKRQIYSKRIGDLWATYSKTEA